MNTQQNQFDYRHQIFINNLNFKTSRTTLHQKFSEFGTITHLYLSEPFEPSFANKGWCLLTYQTSEMATIAIECMNGSFFDGRQINVQQSTGPKLKQINMQQYENQNHQNEMMKVTPVMPTYQNDQNYPNVNCVCTNDSYNYQYQPQQYQQHNYENNLNQYKPYNDYLPNPQVYPTNNQYNQNQTNQMYQQNQSDQTNQINQTNQMNYPNSGMNNSPTIFSRQQHVQQNVQHKQQNQQKNDSKEMKRKRLEQKKQEKQKRNEIQNMNNNQQFQQNGFNGTYNLPVQSMQYLDIPGQQQQLIQSMKYDPQQTHQYQQQQKHHLQKPVKPEISKPTIPMTQPNEFIGSKPQFHKAIPYGHQSQMNVTNNDMYKPYNQNDQHTQQYEHLQNSKTDSTDAITQQNENPKEITNVFVGPLDYSETESELKELFSSYGATKAVILMKMENNIRKPSGSGIVQLPSKEAQERAIKELNGRMYKNRKLVVKKSTSKYFAQQHEYSKTTVKVNYLHEDVGQDELKLIFQKYHPVKTFVHYEIVDGKKKSRGSGWVEFPNEEMQQLAIKEMNDKVYFGRRIVVKEKPLNEQYSKEEHEKKLSYESNEIQSETQLDISQEMDSFYQYEQMNQQNNQYNQTIQNEQYQQYQYNQTLIESVYPIPKTEAQREIVKMNVKQYYNNENVTIEVNGQQYEISLESNIRPGQEYSIENGGSQVNGIQRDLIIQLDYDNENGTYSIQGDDIYHYIEFERQYEGCETTFEMPLVNCEKYEITVEIRNGYCLMYEEKGLMKTDGRRGNYYIVVKLA